MFFLSAESAKAKLYQGQDAFVLLLNKNKIEDTGAFVAFFNMGLELSQGESFLGLKKVDYKIEDSKLFRYTASFEEKWRKLKDLKSYNVGPWLAVRIPRESLHAEKGDLKWRVALFPAGQDKPTILPKAQPGTLNLEQRFITKTYQGKGLPIDVTMAALHSPKLKLPAFSSGPLFDLPALKPSKKKKHAFNLEQHIDPQPNCLYDANPPLQKGLFATHLSHRTPNKTSAVVFDLPQLSDSAQNTWINQARLLACSFKGTDAYFNLDLQLDLPKGAKGGFYAWKGDLTQLLQHVEKTREQHQGELYFYFDSDLSSWDPTLQEASLKIWKAHRLQPIYPPQNTLDSLNHENYAQFLWLKNHLLHQPPLKKLPPLPATLKQLEKFKRIAPAQYAQKLEREILNELKQGQN